MASNKTEHYKLNQWVESDEIHMADFNADNKVLDEALTQLQTAVDSGARMAYGKYTGTDTYGANNPVTLTFDFEPKYIKVILCIDGVSLDYYGLEAIKELPGSTVYGNYIGGNYQSTLYLTWGEHSVSWYNTTSADYSLNNSKYVYYYIAIG